MWFQKLAQVTWKKASGESSSSAFSPLLPAVHSLFKKIFSPWFIHFAGIVFSLISSSLPPCHLFTHTEIGSCRRHGQAGGTSPSAASRSKDKQKPILNPLAPSPSLFILGSIPTALWDTCTCGCASELKMLHTSPEGYISVCRENFAV